MKDYKRIYESSIEEIEDCFSIDPYPPRVLPFKNSFWNAITFELSTSQKFYFRSVEGVLALLSTLGGLLSFSRAACVILVIVFQYQGQL